MCVENETKPEISVIIPCYNAEKTIAKTMNSLYEQKYKNFEVIIVDDGSKDDSVKIIEKYIQSKRIKIRLIKQANAGVSIARNVGIENSKGKYITFLDADDEYMPEFLDELYRQIEEAYVDVVFCKYAFSVSGKINNNKRRKFKEKQLNKYEILDIYLHHRTEHVNFWGGIYKYSLLEKHKIRFPDDIKYGEDSQFFCTYIFYCEKGGIYIEKPMYKYLVNPLSATNRITYDQVQNIEANKNIALLWEKDKKFDRKTGEIFISRAVWAAAKNFATSNMENYERLANEYDIKRAMKIMSRNGDELPIKVSAFLYLLNPAFYLFLVKNYGKIKNCKGYNIMRSV